MTLDELENTLPNGFRDAQLERFWVDLGMRQAVLEFLIDATQTRGKARDYREAVLTLSGVSCFSVEPPRADEEPEDALVLVDSGPLSDAKAKLGRDLQVPPGSFAHYFYCSNKKSFVVVVAQGARLEWVGASVAAKSA